MHNVTFGLQITEFRFIECILNVKLSGNGDQVGLQRIPDNTGVRVFTVRRNLVCNTPL